MGVFINKKKEEDDTNVKECEEVCNYLQIEVTIKPALTKPSLELFHTLNIIDLFVCVCVCFCWGYIASW